MQSLTGKARYVVAGYGNSTNLNPKKQGIQEEDVSMEERVQENANPPVSGIRSDGDPHGIGDPDEEAMSQKPQIDEDFLKPNHNDSPSPSKIAGEYVQKFKDALSPQSITHEMSKVGQAYRNGLKQMSKDSDDKTTKNQHYKSDDFINQTLYNGGKTIEKVKHKVENMEEIAKQAKDKVEDSLKQGKQKIEHISKQVVDGLKGIEEKYVEDKQENEHLKNEGKKHKVD